MDYIEDYGEFNQKTKLDAEGYVESNLDRLIQLFNIEDYSNMEEVKKTLVEYFTRFPDQISRITMNTVGLPKGNNLSLNNIGSTTIKYR